MESTTSTTDPTQVSRRTLFGCGLALLLLPAVGHAGSGRPNFKSLDAFVAGEMRKARIPGLAVGMARDGVVQLVRGYGFADIARRRVVTPDTMFHIASVTKTVTATAIMRLAEAGRLSLDEPVGPHLDFPLINPNHPQTPITFRHLLLHVSSISDARYYEVDFRVRGHDAEMPLVEFLRSYLVPGGRTYSTEGCFARTAPGTTWDYCNVGYGLLGYLASRIGGKDLREQSLQQIFTPLGMHHTSWTIKGTPERLRATPYDVVDGVLVPVDLVGFPDWPAGMLRSSVSDFTRFVAASANGGAMGGSRLIGENVLAQMLHMEKPAGLPTWLTGQGIGWASSRLNGRDCPNHWGGDPGVFSAVYLDPERGSGVAVFTNMTATAESKSAVKDIASHLLDEVARTRSR
jgi:CubicO group peptidase (beta-lactamase class C family)